MAQWVNQMLIKMLIINRLVRPIHESFQLFIKIHFISQFELLGLWLPWFKENIILYYIIIID